MNFILGLLDQGWKVLALSLFVLICYDNPRVLPNLQDRVERTVDGTFDLAGIMD